MQNKFPNAVVTALIAGFLKNIPELLFHHYPKWVELPLWDYAGMVALGHLPRGTAEVAYAFILELLFTVFLGLLFVNIPFLNEYGHYKWKGIFYGAFVWFLIRAVVLAFRIPALLEESIGTSIINLLASMLYGCLLTCGLKMIDRKIEPG